jgi:hypothetical protein
MIDANAHILDERQVKVWDELEGSLPRQATTMDGITHEPCDKEIRAKIIW